MKDSTLVLISEAAALALAVTVTDRLQLNHINFLSDSQQLVQFLNSSDHSNPLDWRIKPCKEEAQALESRSAEI